MRDIMTNAALVEEAESEREELEISEEQADESAAVLKRIFKLRQSQAE